LTQNKVYPFIRLRADEEARIDVKKVLEKIPNVSIKRIVKVTNNVFEIYSTTLICTQLSIVLK
jgi:hemerythrin superfamily protein